jgi:transcription elongation factor GreA
MIKKYTPQKPKPILLTQEKYLESKKEKDLLLNERKQILIRLQTAREMGDLSENGAYTAAKSELRDTDRKIRLLEKLLRRGVITKTKNSGKIEFDSKVVLDNGEKKLNFHLVSGFESNPLKGKLSIFSPLGKALMGKSANQKVTITAPVGKIAYTIVSVE